jgi:xanthine dehydrogenase accessory factor
LEGFDVNIYQTVLNMIAEKQTGVLITVLAGSSVFDQLIGEHRIWRLQGEMDFFTEPFFQDKLNDHCQVALQKSHFQRCRIERGEEWVDLMLEVILPLPRLVIFGCGHVGQAVAQIAALTGWELTVVDDRLTFANPDLFPVGTRVICDGFTRAIEVIQPGENDYIVIVTRGHQYDRVVLEALAGRKLAYAGMIGSRRRVRDLLENLESEGVSKEWLNLLHSPIGLAIGAETPEEIAVSIIAEMIQIRRKGADK